MMALMIALVLHPTDVSKVDGAVIIRDWALSRCVGQAAGAPFRDDAFKSAGALLERSSADVTVFNRVDALIDVFLRRSYGGSVPSQYNMLKCIDFYHSHELDAVVRSARLEP